MSSLHVGHISSQSVHAPRLRPSWLPDTTLSPAKLYKSRSRTHSVLKQQCAAYPETAEGTVSLYAISDLHTDHHANMAWVQQLPSYRSTSSSNDHSTQADTSVLLVAGDISDDMGLLRATLEVLTSKFHVVSFVPGNHELWVKGQPGSPEAQARNAGATDSVAKLHKVLQLCEDLGVLTQPAQIGGLYLVPVLAWHHQSWDKEADIPGIPRASAMTVADYAACVWPEGFPGADVLGAAEVAAWFDAANDEIQQPGWARLQQVLQDSMSPAATAAGSLDRQPQQLQGQGQHLDLVSLSHFSPHQDLLPEKRFLSYPNLAKAVGSDYLWQRLQQLQPDLHVFGHSHFAWDGHVQGIRCIQAPLCYPNERRHRVKSIILQRTPHARDSSSSSSSGQQQQVQSMEAQDHHVANVPWLPVRVYQAHYRAQLVAAAADEQSNSSSSSVSRTSGASILQQFGLPVLHARKLQHSLTDQQQLDAAAVNGSSGSRCSSTGSSSSTSGNGLYTITNWQSSWCSNLFGVWSEYYKVTPREPHNTELAPWVAKRYKKYPRLAQRLAANSK